jgi:RNA polymerase sigma-70 factor, ECF subfamily
VKRKGTLYICMEPTITSGFVATSMENPAAEIQDFDRVVQFYWPRILRFVLASVRDRDVAETLTQDCFWNAYRSRHTFRGDSALHTWLMRIANNSVRRYLRNRRFQFWRQVQQSAVEAAQIGNWLPDRKISPEARTVINQQVQTVWEATKDLSVRQRTIFLLRFMEEMSVLEISEATGLSESTVNVHLFRAVRAVRRRLGENHE